MKTITQQQTIKDYILSAIDTDGYDTTAETEEQKLQFLANTFKKEYSHQVSHYKNSIQKTFVNWLMGLPSSFNIEYKNHAILELSYLFGWIKPNATEEEEDNMINDWFNAIYVNTYYLMKEHNINLK